MLISFTGGGTMGHISPLIAIIEEIKNKKLNIDIRYYGSINSMEEKIIKEKYKYITFVPLYVKGLSKNPIKNIKSLILFKKSTKIVKNDLKNKKPDVIVATGGYVSASVMMAAKSLKIPYIIHEQNVISGKVNKYFSKWANKVFLSFIEASKDYKNGTYILTGNPTLAKKELEYNEHKRFKVLIIGGSLGAKKINDVATSIKNKSLDITLVCGKRYYDNSKNIENINVIDYTTNLNHLINEADLIISRAGATTIYEIITIGKPFITIPSPNVANNHQYKNAKMLELKGCAKMIEEKYLNATTLEEAILEIKLDDNLKKNMIRSQKNLVVYNPNELCLKKILEIAVRK